MRTGRVFLLTAWLVQTTTGGGSSAGQSGGGGGGASYVVWAVALLGIALALFLIEVFLPSAGILGTLSALCAVAGVVLLFQINTLLGLIGAVVALAALPFALALAIKVWPDTPIGRALMLKSDERADVGEAAAASVQKPNPPPLVGKVGKALTDCRPVGTCLIDGRREECLAERSMIEAGATVEVVSVDGSQIKVRPRRG